MDLFKVTGRLLQCRSGFQDFRLWNGSNELEESCLAYGLSLCQLEQRWCKVWDSCRRNERARMCAIGAGKKEGQVL